MFLTVRPLSSLGFLAPSLLSLSGGEHKKILAAAAAGNMTGEKTHRGAGTHRKLNTTRHESQYAERNLIAFNCSHPLAAIAHADALLALSAHASCSIWVKNSKPVLIKVFSAPTSSTPLARN